MKFSTLIALFAVSALSETQAIRLGAHAQDKTKTHAHEQDKTPTNKAGQVSSQIGIAYAATGNIVNNMAQATANATMQQANLTSAVNTTNQAVGLLNNATTSLVSIIASITALNTTIQNAYGLIQVANVSVTNANSTASGIISLQTASSSFAGTIKDSLSSATQLYNQEQADVGTALSKVNAATADLTDGITQNNAAAAYLNNYN